MGQAGHNSLGSPQGAIYVRDHTRCSPNDMTTGSVEVRAGRRPGVAWGELSAGAFDVPLFRVELA